MDGRDVLDEAKQIGGAIISNGMGSPAAIALAGLAVLVVGGIALGRHEYNKHQSEKHLAQIKKILELHKDFLVDIPETGFDEHPSLPAPFTLDNQEKPASASALKLNKAIRNDLKNDKSVNSDSFLIQYSRYIKKAKIHLLGFYDTRLDPNERSALTKGSEDDVTSSVLTYLLVMLSEHCTKFEGYQADLAYLDGIIKFVNAFASLPREALLSSNDPKKRERFERLKEVCRELRLARKLLSDHSNSRTLKSFVDELMSATDKDLIPDLSSLFTKFIVPEKDWQHVDAATPDLLATGFVRPERKNSHTLFHRKAIPIPDSIFKTWLQKITANYLDSEMPAQEPIELKTEHLGRIKELFQICQNFLTLKAPQPQEDGKYATDKFIPVGYDKECQFKLLSKLPPVFELDSFLIIKEGQAWKLYEVREKSQPTELKIAEVKGLQEALTALPAHKPLEKLSKKERKAVNLALTSYRNELQLKARAGIFLDLALLLEQLMDLNNFCQKLSDCIRDLGEIYVTNPHHCNFIFDSLNAFGDGIHNRIGSLLKALEKIEENQDRANDMLIKEQLAVATQLTDKLITIRGKVSSNISGVMEKHKVHNNRWGDPKAVGAIDPAVYDGDKKKKAIQEMLVLAFKLNAKYKIDSSKYDLTKAKPPSLPSPHVYPAHEAALSGTPVLADHEEKQAEVELSPGHGASEEEVIAPDAVLEKLRKRIDDINQKEQPDKKTSVAYEQLYDALNELDLKSKTMEKEKEPQRQAKAKAIKKLTYDLCNETLEFLNYDRKKRGEEAVSFGDKLKDELSASRNKFLDEHKPIFGKILRAVSEVALCLILGLGFYFAHQRGGFFRTSARAAAYQIETRCDNLTEKLAVKV